MRPVTVSRLLGNRRIVVGLGAVVAIAAAVYAIVGLHQSSGPPVANAAAQVLLDTNDSQVVAAGSEGVVTLPVRATLVADLMASDQLTTLVAREADIPASHLEVIDPSSMAGPAFLTPLVTKAAPFALDGTSPYVVSLMTDELMSDNPTQIITVETQAPDETRAKTLADAAISVLRSVFATQRAGQVSGFVVRTVLPPHRIVLPHRSRRVVYALVGAIVIFVFWYGATLLASGLARRVRRPQLA